MQKQKAAQKAGRSTKGIRFHPYGLASSSGDGIHDRDVDEPRRMAWVRTARLEVAALAMAGVVLAVTAVAWVVRLLG